MMRKITFVTILMMVYLEWLDFTLYLYAIKTVFQPYFFSTGDKGLVLAFLVFSTAYLARPIGGYCLGRYADTYGRKMPLLFSSGLMGFATFLMCFIPSYHDIGAWSTILLLLCRLCQGFALGGEVNTAAIFLIEHVKSRPHIVGSYVAIAGALGMFQGGILASFLVIHPDAWRWIFSILGILSIAIACIRKQLQESPMFIHEKALKQTDDKDLINYQSAYWRIAVVGVYVSSMVYLCNIYWVSFASSFGFKLPLSIERTAAVCQLLSALLGWLIAVNSHEQSNDKRLAFSPMILMLTVSFLFYGVVWNKVWMVLIGLIGYILSNGFLCSSLFYYLFQQLPVLKRCQGISFTWGISASIGAMMLPIVQIMVNNQDIWFPVVYLMLVSTICLNGVSFLPNKFKI